MSKDLASVVLVMNRVQSKGSTMTPVQNNRVVMKTTSPQPGMPMLKLEAVYTGPGVAHTILMDLLVFYHVI